MLREILVLRALDHPNICRLFEIIDTPLEIFMVMEYARSAWPAGASAL